MPNKNNTSRTITTVDGTVLHVFENEESVIKPHSVTGPAILYSKEHGKSDEYCIYGVKYNYDKWLELTRPFRRASSKDDLLDA